MNPRFFSILCAALLCSAQAYAQTIITAPAQVGSGTPNSSDPAFTLTNPVDSSNPGISSHGFLDSRPITRGGGVGDASLDLRPHIKSGSYDHQAGIQCRPIITTTGTIEKIHCLVIAPDYTNATVSEQEDITINGPAIHSGTVAKHRGLKCVANSHPNSKCIEADMPSDFNAKVTVKGPPGELARFATKTPNSADRWITVGAEDLNSEGGRIGYNGSSGNMWMGCNYTTCKFEILSKKWVTMTNIQPATSGSVAACWVGNELVRATSGTCP
jgi:hypothetical protein